MDGMNDDERVPETVPDIADHEEQVKHLLREGKEQEALQLHRDLTGMGVEEAEEMLASLRAGL